jgi:hypothetical protein
MTDITDDVIAWEWYDETGNVHLTHEEPPEIGATRIVPLAAIQRQRERQAVAVPVAWRFRWKSGSDRDREWEMWTYRDTRPQADEAKIIEPLYAAPPADTVKQDDRLQRIADSLRLAGASLPAPPIQGTIESSIITGLSIALALVENEINPSAMSDCPQPIVEELTNE